MYMYVCVCMCVCVCNHSIDRNFYPINTKFGTQVKKIKLRVKLSSKMDYVGSIGILGSTNKKYISVNFEVKV